MSQTVKNLFPHNTTLICRISQLSSCLAKFITPLSSGASFGGVMYGFRFAVFSDDFEYLPRLSYHRDLDGDLADGESKAAERLLLGKETSCEKALCRQNAKVAAPWRLLGSGISENRLQTIENEFLPLFAHSFGTIETSFLPHSEKIPLSSQLGIGTTEE
jgi:hypothetical protein